MVAYPDAVSFIQALLRAPLSAVMEIVDREYLAAPALARVRQFAERLSAAHLAESPAGSGRYVYTFTCGTCQSQFESEVPHDDCPECGAIGPAGAPPVPGYRAVRVTVPALQALAGYRAAPTPTQAVRLAQLLADELAPGRSRVLQHLPR